jgi:hypothetical protein
MVDLDKRIGDKKMYPSADLKEFVKNSGKYLALMKQPNYFTLFVSNDKDKTTKEILNIVNDLGICNSTIYNYDRVDFLIDEKEWYYLIDYSGGVIES